MGFLCCDLVLLCITWCLFLFFNRLDEEESWLLVFKATRALTSIDEHEDSDLSLVEKDPCLRGLFPGHYEFPSNFTQSN